MTTLCIEVFDINPKDIVVIVTRDQTDLTHAFPYDFSVGYVFMRCAVSVHKNTNSKYYLFLIHDREGYIQHRTLASREDDTFYVRLDYETYVTHLANEMYFKMGADTDASILHYHNLWRRAT